MIGLVKLLTQHKPIVLVLLAAPLLSLGFSSRFYLHMVPPSPYVKFEVTFSAPARTASEIAKRVTEPAERVFNGLPGLLSMESRTLNEVATIELVFKEGIEGKTAYLYVQEKLDRINLILPGDVKSTKVTRVEHEKPANVMYSFKKPVSAATLRKLLKPLRSKIIKTRPEIEGKYRIEVRPDIVALKREGLSVSNIVTALKSSGLSTAIGRKQGVMFGTGMTFEQIEDLKAAVVGSRGHRPVKLNDVAQIDFAVPEPIEQLSVWIDVEHLTVAGVTNAIEKQYTNMSVDYPYFFAVVDQCIQPLAVLLFIIVFQAILFRLVFGHRVRLWSLAIFDGLILTHFGFWKGLFLEHLTVLDLHSVIWALIVATTFWVALLSRIRTYFLPDTLIKRPPKSVEQATLFSMAELFPTYLLLVVGLWIMSLPVMTTGINLPSRYILESFFYVGMPTAFSILIFVPVFTNHDWLESGGKLPVVNLNWSISPSLAKAGSWIVLVSLIVAPLTFQFMKFGIGPQSMKSFAQEMVEDLRGYGNKLIFLAKPQDRESYKKNGFVVYEANESMPTRFWDFTPSGLRFLSHLDLMGFGSALMDMRQSKFFGFLEDPAGSTPLHFAPAAIGAKELGQLLIAGNSQEVQAKPVGLIAANYLGEMESRVLRSQLSVTDRIVVKDDLGSIETKLPEGVKPNPWSSFLLDELNAFSEFHYVSLLFLFILLSLYLNSFVRGALVFIFTLVPTALFFLFRTVLPGVYNADSLWMLYVVPWSSVFVLLIISRIVDIERTRGFDRDISVEEIRRHFAPSIAMTMWFVVACFFVMGVTEQLSFVPSLGFWKEGLLVAVLVAFMDWLTNRTLFPLFYFTSEEAVDSILFRVYKIISLKGFFKN
jgi:hypothetical protein